MPSDIPVLCVSPITGATVLYAPRRAERANALVREPLTLPTTDACPFCPGNESDTPAEVYRWPPASADEPWQVRIVPNRYPAVATFDEALNAELASSAYGQHEVLIESARHDDDWQTLSVEQLARIFEAAAERIRFWSKDSRSQHIQIFKNVGVRAGATLAHPHLQLMSLNYLPRYITTEFERGEALINKFLQQMVDSKDLLVHTDSGYVTLCPSVSRVPYELWVLPRHPAAYATLSYREYQALAAHLKATLDRLIKAIGVVAHNIIWRLPPLSQDHLPWRIEILPRLTTFAGLELGSGLYINPIRPELSAEQLASAILPA